MILCKSIRRKTRRYFHHVSCAKKPSIGMSTTTLFSTFSGAKHHIVGNRFGFSRIDFDRINLVSVVASVVSTSTQGIPIQFEHDPQSMKCPLCRKHIVTHVEYEVGNESCYGALILAFCGCFCGCCLLPFCLTECQDAVHSCPECRVIIGRQGSM